MALYAVKKICWVWNWSGLKHSAAVPPQPQPPMSHSLHPRNMETASVSPPSHSVLCYTPSSNPSLFSHSLQREAQSDRCNTAVEAWAELAGGCRGPTRASSSWQETEQRRGHSSAGHKTVVILPVVAVQSRANFASECVDQGAHHPVNVSWTLTAAPIQMHGRVSETCWRKRRKCEEQESQVTWFPC